MGRNVLQELGAQAGRSETAVLLLLVRVRHGHQGQVGQRLTLVAIVIFNPLFSLRLERHQPHLSPCNRAYNNGVGDVVVREVQTVSALVPEPFRAPKTQKKESNNSRCCAVKSGESPGLVPNPVCHAQKKRHENVPEHRQRRTWFFLKPTCSARNQVNYTVVT